MKNNGLTVPRDRKLRAKRDPKTRKPVTDMPDTVWGTDMTKTMTAQGRLQGIIVSVMPLFLGIVMTVLKPKLMLPFFCSLTGLGSIVAVIALITVGWLIIRKIIKIDV